MVNNVSKYEKDEKTKTIIFADDISVYPQKAMGGKITYAGQGVGERKNAPIKARMIKTQGRPLQFTFELQGDYHVENLSYFNSDPNNWQSYGKIWLDLENAEKLAEWILAAIDVYAAKKTWF